MRKKSEPTSAEILQFKLITTKKTLDDLQDIWAEAPGAPALQKLILALKLPPIDTDTMTISDVEEAVEACAGLVQDVKGIFVNLGDQDNFPALRIDLRTLLERCYEIEALANNADDLERDATISTIPR